MIRTNRRLTAFRGTKGELFKDLQRILRALRVKLSEDMSTEEIDKFISNAIKSTRELTREEIERFNAEVSAEIAAFAEEMHCKRCECAEDCEDEDVLF